jgi:2-(3-amino-3-carboxypropyl)histidine synthase
VGRAPSTDGSSYQLEIEKALDLIRRSGAKRVGLQAPAGLQRLLLALAETIRRETGATVTVSGDPCYGACDVDMALAREVDLLIHLGHAELGEAQDKVFFLEARMPVDLREAVKRAVPLLASRRIGVFTTVQHLHKLPEALAALAENGIEGLLGAPAGRLKYPGQVLGCSYGSARSLNVEEHLFIGTGSFHPLGLALATGRRVVAADPVAGTASAIDPESLLRRRFAKISRAWEARKFAVLVSKKPGQRRLELARRLAEKGRAQGLEMVLVYLDIIEPDRLLNLGVEAAVCTACPRIAVDDADRYSIPLLTPPEFEILLGQRQWEEYEFDEME